MKKCKYRRGYKYQLAEDYCHHVGLFPKEDIVTEFLVLTTKGKLLIKRGYAWDGPSGPSIDTDTFMRGSLVHDAGYQLIAQGHLHKRVRPYLDRMLKNICLEDGMFSFRAWYVYKTVRKFGGGHLNRKVTFTAP